VTEPSKYGVKAEVSYRTLNAVEIVNTIRTLEERITQRFPDASLGKVCHDLHAIGVETQRKAELIARPNLLLRVVTVVAILCGLTGLVFFGWTLEETMHPQMEKEDVFAVIEGLDAATHILILAAGALFFAVSLEDRIKRRRSLRDLHVFRSFAHVIDMHQLTKDPGALLGYGPSTASSPKRTMSKYELTRYLDYCSEMQSLTGKLAALYAQNLPDPIVIDAVYDIEELTAGFSRKVWQKLSILESYDVAAVQVGLDRYVDEGSGDGSGGGNGN
jgi:hypothetical protein